MINNHFPLRLAQLMREHQIDDRELSNILNVSTREVKRWLSGSVIPNTHILIRLCEILRSTPNYILGFGEHPCKLASGIRNLDLFNEFIAIIENPYKYCVTGYCDGCSIRESVNCFDYLIANELVNRGYVRASVLAKKIFDEIEANAYVNIMGYAHISGCKLEDLRKKFGG